MNKIRVIDLLNKIANGEEAPKKLKLKGSLNDYEFHFNRKYNCYDLIGEKFEMGSYMFGFSILNDEIEIIEEYKQIEKLMRLDSRETSDCIIKIQDKINELIDKVNELEEGKK